MDKSDEQKYTLALWHDTLKSKYCILGAYQKVIVLLIKILNVFICAPFSFGGLCSYNIGLINDWTWPQIITQTDVCDPAVARMCI